MPVNLPLSTTDEPVPTSIRALLRDSYIVAPGVYDSLTARLVEDAGFSAAMVTGAGVAASTLAVPDIGLLTMLELLGRTRDICRATSIPIIADCETGYGGPLSVRRTVEEFEAAGVSALFLEDQESPKRCGHFDRKRLTPTLTMQRRLDAALAARRNDELMIVARTDAVTVTGLSDALGRARDYAKIGVDGLFVESPRSLGELHRIADALVPLGIPLMINLVEGGRTPLVPVTDLVAMGYSIVCFSGTLQKTAIHAMQGVLEALHSDGSVDSYYPSRMISLDERSRILRLGRFEALDDEYSIEQGKGADKPTLRTRRPRTPLP